MGKEHKEGASSTEIAMEKAAEAQTVFDQHPSPETFEARQKANRDLLFLQKITLRRIDIRLGNVPK